MPLMLRHAEKHAALAMAQNEGSRPPCPGIIIIIMRFRVPLFTAKARLGFLVNTGILRACLDNGSLKSQICDWAELWLSNHFFCAV